MKAIRVHEFGPPGVMKVENIPDPRPGPDQVLVRIHAVGVNPVDTYIRSGNYASLPALPYTPGVDAAGVIEATGQRVYVAGTVTGAYAEFCICETRQVHPLPAALSFDQGAAVNIPYATAYIALHLRAQARPGETVLVHGATGGVGIAAVQLALAHGCRVIGTAGSDAGKKLLQEQGVYQVIPHGELAGIQADVILEMLANVNLAKDLTAVARRGRIAIIGNRGTIEINPREIMRREATLVGVFGGTPEELASVHAALGAGLANGTLRPVINQQLPLAEAPRAHELVMSPGAAGKIVLRP